MINQHLSLFARYNRLKTHLLGTFDKKANIRAVLEDAYDSAAQLCDRNYMDSPQLNLTIVNDTELAGESALEICYAARFLRRTKKNYLNSALLCLLYCLNK